MSACCEPTGAISYLRYRYLKLSRLVERETERRWEMTSYREGGEEGRVTKLVYLSTSIMW